MKKLYFLCLALLPFLLTTCQTLQGIIKEPELSFDSVDISAISFDGVDLLCKINVANPNPISIPFPQIDWKLFVAGNANSQATASSSSFLNGSIPQGNAINAGKTTMISLPLHVDFASLIQTLSTLKGANQLNYAIQAIASFNFESLPIVNTALALTGTELSMNKTFQGTLPIPLPPVIKFRSLSMAPVSATAMAQSLIQGNAKLNFELDMEVNNPNSFALNLNSLDYNLEMAGDTWSAGQAQDKLALASGQTLTLPLNFTLNAQNMVKTIWTWIMQGKDLNYSLTGGAQFSADIAGLEALNLPFSLSGDTKL
jgi:LEA14-like dessication related protein